MFLQSLKVWNNHLYYAMKKGYNKQENYCEHPLREILRNEDFSNLSLSPVTDNKNPWKQLSHFSLIKPLI